MRVVLISVTHTGTNLLEDILKNGGFSRFPLEGGPRDVEGDAYYVGHVLHMNHSRQAEALGREIPVICPLRHPYRVEESWKRRGKNIGEMVDAFRDLVGRSSGANFLPVDIPGRNYWLERLAGVLGRDLATDWPVKRSVCGTHSLELGECTPSLPVVALARELSEFLRGFYGCQRQETGK
ncbi:MAG: hypothetical protein GY789_17385 [Hyphomicrobiales bacterium]|nr:hypothetical protein [Hyphomicrobiales bacterium]